jgi:hypothetical protein
MSYASSVLRLARIPVLVACLGLLLAGCGVNNIPSYDEAAKAKWSDVLNQYQRRADLIPNLVETVKGYAAQERQVLEEVTNARARATQVQVQIPPDIVNNPEAFKRFQEAQAQLTGALGRLLAVSERYPDLKSNQNCPAVAARGHGESHCGRTPRLHRGGAAIQYRAAYVPWHHLGLDSLQEQQADGDVHGGGGREDAAAGQILIAQRVR